MNYVKPQKPLIQDGKGIYPITTIDQVVRADGRRFSENEFNRVFQRNLLRPTLQTQTINGVTCTNNGDGTYTVNGTSTGTINLALIKENTNLRLPKGTFKVLCSNDVSRYYIASSFNGKDCYENVDTNYFNNINGTVSVEYLYAQIPSGKTFNNDVIKPMITDDLSATYDDFISYDDSVITGINSGVKMDLLWENASPTSEFTPQTINLDLSNYKGVFICSKRDSTLNGLHYDFFVVGSTNGRIIVPDDILYFRTDIIVNVNSIYFATGYKGSSVNNSACVPYQIYGVK